MTGKVSPEAAGTHFPPMYADGTEGSSDDEIILCETRRKLLRTDHGDRMSRATAGVMAVC